jgi:uncharacterized protein (DUF1800 family)
MKHRLPHLLLLATLTFLASCSSTKVLSEWKTSGPVPARLSHLRILAVEPDTVLRQDLETESARQLSQGDVQAATTCQDARFTLGAIQQNKEAAATAMASEGADGVLVIRLVDEKVLTQHVVRQEPTIARTPYQFDPAVPVRSWTRFYDDAFTGANSRTEVRTNRVVAVESNLYTLPAGDLLWSARSETFIQEGADRAGKIEAFVSTLVKRLQGTGLLR